MTVPLHPPVGLSAGPARRDVARTVPLGAAAVGVAAGATGVLDAEQALGPLVVALLVGLPHGAVDHLVLARRLRGRVGWLVGTIGYAGAALAVFAALQVAPLLLWSAFLLLSAWHFGTADREHLTRRAEDGGARRADTPSWTWAVAAGALPVAGLMVTAPPALRSLAQALDPALGVLLAPAVTRPVALLTAAVIAVALVVEGRAGRWRSVAELALVGALFAVAPPLWAFGIYFGLWHSVRHVGRMVAEEAPWADIAARSGTAAAVRRFALDALPPTAIALVAGVLLLRIGGSTGGVDVTAVALQVTAAVTFPHALTVAWLDRRTSA